jgi:hypothetical protein
MPPIPADARHLDDAPQIVGRDPPSDWLVVDAGHQSVHLFSPELRAEYDLDGMWTRRLLRHAQMLDGGEINENALISDGDDIVDSNNETTTL